MIPRRLSIKLGEGGTHLLTNKLQEDERDYNKLRDLSNDSSVSTLSEFWFEES